MPAYTDRQIEREEDSIQRDYEEGLISSAEAARSMRELHRDIADAEREEADRQQRDREDRW
jgi:hypothetical protein